MSLAGHPKGELGANISPYIFNRSWYNLFGFKKALSQVLSARTQPRSLEDIEIGTVPSYPVTYILCDVGNFLCLHQPSSPFCASSSFHIITVTDWFGFYGDDGGVGWGGGWAYENVSHTPDSIKH